MSDNLDVQSVGSKVKHTVLWNPEDWTRMEQAMRRLEEQTHTEVDIPKFIRGSVMRRVEEILGAAA